MKITTSQLKRIIKEEVSRVIMEAEAGEMLEPVPGVPGLSVKYKTVPAGVFATLVGDSSLGGMGIPQSGNMDPQAKYLVMTGPRGAAAPDEATALMLLKKNAKSEKAKYRRNPDHVALIDSFLTSGV